MYVNTHIYSNLTFQTLRLYEQNVNRTCNLVVGVGDGKVDSSPSADNFKTPKVNGIEYSGRVAIPYDDVNQLPVNATWHPQVRTVYDL